ncbi:hypothetical protein Y1Q_0019317 [Alligator mississippiensis]|uniref:Uncharacterized protein n=1 Tax=Alligator mississippiensis TaxID=8496 RepID=A0A151MQS3_ALLMI|nr:hypothetical protein Y1Q_0019317 [Alligator mississippiensis]
MTGQQVLGEAPGEDLTLWIECKSGGSSFYVKSAPICRKRRCNCPMTQIIIQVHPIQKTHGVKSQSGTRIFRWVNQHLSNEVNRTTLIYTSSQQSRSMELSCTRLSRKH